MQQQNTPATLAAIAEAQADPTNEAKMRAALELCPYSSIILGPQWYEKPWQLNNIKLCKELKKPMIIVCWKDSALRNGILDDLLAVAVIQLAPEQKSRDPEVQAQIQEAWLKYGGQQPKVWGAHRLQAAAAAFEYPPETLQALARAFPAHTIIDGSNVAFESLPEWVARLEANPSHLLVVLRRKSTPSDHLFQMMGIGADSPDAEVVTALSASSAILVFHKDDYYHLPLHPLPTLVAFLRRQMGTDQNTARECMVCCDVMPVHTTHRLACAECGTSDVCNTCVMRIKDQAGNGAYACPQCRSRPGIILVETGKLPHLQAAAAAAAAAASSNAAAPVDRPPAPLVPSVSRVHVEVLPPSEYAGMNSEQDFSIPLRDLQRVPGGLLAVGARVSENDVRIANVVSTEGQPATSGEEGQPQVKSALNLVGLKIASKGPREGYTVPVMLHNDPADIRFTVYEADQKTVKWTATVRCQLPLSWPRGPVSSRWQKAGDQVQDWQKLTMAQGSLDTAEEVVYETDAHGRAVEHELLLTGAMDDNPHERIQVRLVIQKAYNPSTKEPIAYFIDRWWALRKIAVVVQPARFVDGHYCFGCNKAVELGAGALRCPCKVEKHVVYCSKECQKKDWKRHKGVCTAKKNAGVSLSPSKEDSVQDGAAQSSCLP
jgi:hypothetical protein